MASALPVVAFDCPFGPGEILRDGTDGVLVAAEDVGALAAALGRLMADPRRRGARRRRFDRAQVMARWDEVIAAARSGHRATSAALPLSDGRPS